MLRGALWAPQLAAAAAGWRSSGGGRGGSPAGLEVAGEESPPCHPVRRATRGRAFCDLLK